MSIHLYDLPAHFRAIADELDALDGEPTPELLDRLNALEGTLEEKARWRVALIREREAEADAIKQEVARLKKMAEAKENAAKRLKDDLLGVMQAIGVPKMDVGIAKIGVQQASRPAIAWAREEPIPAGYQRVKVELDGNKAYEAWKEGQLPDGFEVKFTTYLGIR